LGDRKRQPPTLFLCLAPSRHAPCFISQRLGAISAPWVCNKRLPVQERARNNYLTLHRLVVVRFSQLTRMHSGLRCNILVFCAFGQVVSGSFVFSRFGSNTGPLTSSSARLCSKRSGRSAQPVSQGRVARAVVAAAAIELRLSIPQVLGGGGGTKSKSYCETLFCALLAIEERGNRNEARRRRIHTAKWWRRHPSMI
jgi:hypothetical protein